MCVSVWLCMKERSISSRAPLEDNKHFKGSLRDAEHDICPKTQGLSADPPLFSLRLARRQSKMSFSLTLFWWICSAVCLLKSTTEDLANEPWALWIKQQGGNRWQEKSLTHFERLKSKMLQKATWPELTVAAGSHLHGRKSPVWLRSDGLLAFPQQETFCQVY